MPENKPCEHCEERPAKTFQLGFWLCSECLAELKVAEQHREDEEAEALRKEVEGTWTKKPSIVSDLYSHAVKKGLKIALITAADKVEDYSDTNIMPLVHRLSDDEVNSLFALIERQYFALKSALDIRRSTRKQEAEVIRRSRKVEKSREKAETQIAKQKKFASKDKTLSKEERLKAKLVESLMALGMSEEQAKAQAEKVKK